MKITRELYQNREMTFLAPYAVKSSESRGRKVREKEDEYRTVFQRDRDRIVHSTAFRRLQYKTQVFLYYEGDHYRTRLTHTLETSQIARSISRALALNEDLTEAIALAHDLGHGPFGHAGEWALQGLMASHGGFEHNAHALRIVEKLEDRYPEFPGLNLCFETLEGLKKDARRSFLTKKHCFRSLEAEVVDLADEISYLCHDLDDGLRSELISEEQSRCVFLWREASRAISKKYSRLACEQKRRLVIRMTIDKLVKGALANTARMIKSAGIGRLEDLQKTDVRIVEFSDSLKKQADELKSFLRNELYQHYRIIRMTDKGQRFLKALFQVYLDRPSQLPPEMVVRSQKDGIRRVICDHLAGMTDRFAIDEYKRFFEPDERV
jgi:dGTPase